MYGRGLMVSINLIIDAGHLYMNVWQQTQVLKHFKCRIPPRGLVASGTALPSSALTAAGQHGAG